MRRKLSTILIIIEPFIRIHSFHNNKKYTKRMFSYMNLPQKRQKTIVDEEKVIQVHSSIKLINEREKYTEK